tara:strand:+ start:506 stop:1033 length:528 start_codon:yes stop_codon:yes gene_type:complete
MADNLPIIKEALRRAGGLYIEYLKDELDFQKHVASGSLKNGFYVRVHKVGKGLRMDVMNNNSYMDIVNNGASGGVNASYSELDEWTSQKESRGELNFSSVSRRRYFINKVKTELESKYLTIGGDKVAPRRYFFIETAFETANAQGVEKDIENSISLEIDAILNKYGSFKAIQLTI